MPLILPGNVASATAAGYDVANSCRFNPGDSPYMYKTVVSPTSATISTVSFWMKATGVTDKGIFAARTDTNNRHSIYWEGQGNARLELWGKRSGSVTVEMHLTRQHRDPAAWIHHVIGIDTTQSTAGNRVKWYVNGVQQSIFTTETQATEDSSLEWSVADATIAVGAYAKTSGFGDYFDGYLAEVVFIDGIQYAASDFGEFDSDSPSTWKPKDPSGLTFGNNGFYLDFEASDNLGNDANGGTDLTESGLAAVDQYIDSPTNNFATMNPLGGECTLTQGNTMVQHSGSGNDQQNSHTTLAVSKGRWYAEMKVTMHATSGSGRYYPGIGVSDVSLPVTSNPLSNTYMGGVAGTYAFMANGQTDYAGSQTAGDASSQYATDDIVGIYLDLESATKTMKIHKNGTEIESVNIAAPISFYAIGNNIHNNGSNCRAKWNFGSAQYDETAVSSGNADPNGYGSFEYSTTESSLDYYALCTKNIAEFG